MMHNPAAQVVRFYDERHEIDAGKEKGTPRHDDALPQNCDN